MSASTGTNAHWVNVESQVRESGHFSQGRLIQFAGLFLSLREQAMTVVLREAGQGCAYPV
jgi:hypothetical protein